MKTIIVFFTLLLLSSVAVGQQELVNIDGIYPEDLEVEGFMIDREQEVELEAAGYFNSSRNHDVIFGNAWILNATTREVVWELQDPDFEQENPDDDFVRFEGAVSLPAGSYEVYYSSYPIFFSYGAWQYSGRHRGDGWSDFSRAFGNLVRGRDWDEWWLDRDLYGDFKIVVKGEGKKLSYDDLQAIRERRRNRAYLSFDMQRDELREERGFEVTRPTEVEIYAVGEADRDGNYDYGVILNAKNMERAWELDYRKSDYAGGARKNRMIREKITLPAGHYVAIFTTDDSHSPRHWNSAPPHDPAFYGLTLTLADASQRSNFKAYDFDGFQFENPVVSFAGVGDDEIRKHGITVKRPTEVRVYALGEGRKGEMYDYGWIVDAKTHQKVWSMEYYATDAAGGGRKNRRFDGRLKLEKGSYIAYYITDDSHSYPRWNTAPPIDGVNWGMQIIGDQADFDEYEAPEEVDALARITRMRDHDLERVYFSLDKERDVRVYALGEGRHGGMYDFGWIEEKKSRKVVWEMSYGRTEHAGGASKNRMVNETIRLAPGDYILYYETDGSHSYRDWNDTPPFDPENWGITIYLADSR